MRPAPQRDPAHVGLSLVPREVDTLRVSQDPRGRRGVWVLTVPAESPEVGLAVTLRNFSVMGFPGDFRIAEPVERKLTGWLRASREAVGVEPLLL